MDKDLEKKRLPWRLIGIAMFSLLVLLIWRVPQWSLPSDIDKYSSKDRTELLIRNRESIFKLIQTLGGLGFIYTAYLTWLNFQVTEDKQVTDRFSKAIEMLADEKLEVRIGGIYLLERIAKDSKEDHSVVIEVLTAYVRNNTLDTTTGNRPDENSLRKPSSDIQSALTVIGRREIENDIHSLELSSVHLKGADLTKANLEEAALSRACLEDADLSGACLERANLSGAFLEEVILSQLQVPSETDPFAIIKLSMLPHVEMASLPVLAANLRDSNLQGAHLKGALLIKVCMERANLGWANLDNAILAGAHLEGANLLEATMDGAYLREACLRKADLSHASLKEADLSEVSLEGANLAWTNLESAKGLNEIQLSQAILCRTILPEGVGLDADRDCQKLRIVSNPSENM